MVIIITEMAIVIEAEAMVVVVIEEDAASQKKRNKGYGMSSKHFKGACKDIEDNIFVVNKPNAADTYNKSVEAISNYVGREYSQGRDILRCIEAVEIIDIEMPKEERS